MQTTRTERILELITEEYQSRAQLAKKLGKKRLTQSDFEALMALEAMELIECERRPDYRPAGVAHFYRLAQS